MVGVGEEGRAPGVLHRFARARAAVALPDASAPARRRPPCRHPPPGWTLPASNSSASAPARSSSESRPRRPDDVPVDVADMGPWEW